MKKMIQMLRDNLFIKKTLYISVCVTLGLYFFSIPSFSNRSGWHFISYGLMGLLIVVTFLFILLYGQFSFDKKIVIPFSFAFYAFICTMINTPNNWRMWVSVLLMCFSFMIIFYSCKTINNLRLTLKVLVAAFFGFAIYFCLIPEYRIKILSFDISMSDRLGGYFDNVNMVGSYFAIGFGLSLYLGLVNKRKIEYLYCLMCLPFAYLGLFTGSRAFILLIAIYLITIFYVKLSKRKIVFFTVLVMSIVLLVFLVMFIQPIKEQFDKTLYTLFGIGEPDYKKIDTSTVERVLWMRYGFILGSQNMIIGLGCDGFSVHSGIEAYTHNNFAEVLCDFGVPGFCLFYFFVIYPFILYFVSKKEFKTIVIPITFYFIIKSLFGVYYNYKDFYLLIAVCYFAIDDVSFSDLSHKIALKFKTNTREEISI